MSNFIPFAQCAEEQCPRDPDCMLVKEHAGDCYVAVPAVDVSCSKPSEETIEWAKQWQWRREQHELDRFGFACGGPTEEVTVITMLRGYPGKVKRIVFSDAESWHVTRIQVGLCDQLELGGVNAAALADNCQAMIEKVTGGRTLRLTIRQAEGHALTNGEIVFYGEKLDG